MTIKHPETFNNWPPAGFDGEFAWDFLLPSWSGTNIEPMDIDAMVERRGHFLVFETKKDGKDVPLGQKITLTELWKRGFTTIIQVAGKRPEEITGYALYPEGEFEYGVQVGDKELKPVNYMGLAWVVRRWFCWASGWDRPTREEFDNEIGNVR